MSHSSVAYQHESLISGSHIFLVLLLVHGGSDVGILWLDVDDDLAVIAVKSGSLTGETDLLGNLSGDSLEVDLVGGDRDLTEENNHTGLGSSLHSNSGVGVNLEASIKDTVGDLIAELVWVTFSN